MQMNEWIYDIEDPVGVNVLVNGPCPYHNMSERYVYRS